MEGYGACAEHGWDSMRLPVIYNSNFQVQDQDGVIICDLFRNPNAEEDGKKIMALLNLHGGILDAGSVAITPLISITGSPDFLKGSNGVTATEAGPKIDVEGQRVSYPVHAVKMSRSDRMKAIWAEKRAKKLAKLVSAKV